MNLDDLEQVVKKVLRAMAKNQDTLVYCHVGRHHSGSFLIFVIAFIEEGSKVQNMMDQYIDDPACQPHKLWLPLPNMAQEWPLKRVALCKARP